ncbi:MAG: dephospho-CoA kinase [Flavobacteriales bacterium]|nr:dephospho-CoA kinase [Flavobacteriales bacterium]|tara:strand:- start:29144 stop:29749 length:606 start_codon:yes stop_codon:yes gene_type:complete
MLRIGITGGIGSGKSTVCNVFKNLGVPVFSADIAGKQLLNKDELTKQKVKKHFGDEMYTSEGEIDRKRLAQLVFSDPKELERLNSIIHPRVKEKFEEWSKNHSNKPYVIKEAAILFETGYYQDLDKIINVFAPKEQRIKRVMKRDEAGREEVERRMRFQYSDDERNNLADFIIMNEDGQEMELLPQVMELHELFLNQSSQW